MSGQLVKNDNTLSFQISGQNLLRDREPKKYIQYSAKSADFNKTKFPTFSKINGRRMSIEETNSQNPMISNNSAFEKNKSAFERRKSISNISGNDNSYSVNNPNLSVYEEENKFTKMMNDPTIDLEDYPVPPIPKMYKSSTKLFVPNQLDRQIQSLMSKASEATCNGEYQQAK